MTINQGTRATGALAFDAQSLEQLKLQAKSDPGKAVAGAAKQFESLFLGMVLKSMREATPQTGMFDNEQTKLYTSLLDQQLAQHLAARGTGLSEVMARQLSGHTGSVAPKDLAALAADPAQPSGQSSAPSSALSALSAAPAPGAASASLQLSTLALARLNIDPAPAAGDTEPDPVELPPSFSAHAVDSAPAGRASVPAADAAPANLARTTDFVNRIWSHAVDAARSIGVQPRFMVGQAALESGWGKHEIRTADGSSSHNLFGVKAGRGWTGPVVEKTTTEYVNGAALKTTAKFRVYGSYAEAFKDYANLMKDNPRYAGVVGQAQDAKGFAKGLQRAGYATDPAYADKLVRVINGATLRVSLQGEPAAQMLARR